MPIKKLFLIRLSILIFSHSMDITVLLIVHNLITYKNLLERVGSALHAALKLWRLDRTGRPWPLKVFHHQAELFSLLWQSLVFWTHDDLTCFENLMKFFRTFIQCGFLNNGRYQFRKSIWSPGRKFGWEFGTLSNLWFFIVFPD